MFSQRSLANHLTAAILGLGGLLGSLTATNASAAPAVYAPKAYKKAVKLPLMPGAMVGHINAYTVQRGDTLPWIAARFGLHPSHVTKPSGRELEGGMRRGQVIHVDQRRIEPTFKPNVSGIVLNLPEAEVYLVNQGSLVRAYPVAVSNADWKAPIGDTHVVDMDKNPTWYIPKKIQAEMKKNGQTPKEKVDPGPNNPLGVRWIGFADGSYGFHGTTVPTSIKHYASHGCVRFLHDDIVDLYDRVHVGMPVHVLYQPVTLAVDHEGVWLSVFPDYYGLGFDFRGAVKALAQEAGVTNRLDWHLVEHAFLDKDGTVALVSKGAHPVAHPSPKPKPSPKPTAKSSTRPSESPTASPAGPSASPSASFRPIPTMSPGGSPTTAPSLAPSVSPSAAASTPPPTLPPTMPRPLPSTAASPNASPS